MMLEPFMNIENLQTGVIIVVAMIATWFITYFKFGFGWFLILLFSLLSSYSRSYKSLGRKLQRQAQQRQELRSVFVD
jgi:Ca2+-dependent lipid-binding protein